MKTIQLIVALLISYLLAVAQQPTQTVRGTITDEATQLPVPYATVSLLNTDPPLGTTTDLDGKFVLPNVPIGRYNVQVSFVGYEPTVVKELMVSSSKEVIVNLGMKPSTTALGEVVVKANVSKEQPLNSMSIVSARMLSVEEAKRYAGGFDDPARLASSFAGVASNVRDNGIVVRGNAPKSLQWKMEGVEIPNPNHFADLSAFGGGGLTALSTNMLANSDFLTGAFPAEYSNALSGVFDIFMRNGNNEQYEHVVQLGLIGIDVGSEGPFKKGKSSYLFNYRYSTLALLGPLLPEDAAGTQYQDLSFKLNFPTKKSGTFSVWGIGLMDKSGQTAKTDSTEWKYLQNMEEGDVKQYMGASGINHRYLFKNNMQLKTSLATTVSGIDWYNKRMNNLLELRPQSQVQNTNLNFVFTSSVIKKYGQRHTNKTGVVLTGMMYDLFLSDAGQSGDAHITLVDERGFSSLLTAYTNSSIQLGTSVSLNIGVNAQLFTLNNQYTIEPRAGLKWQLNEKQYLGLAYGLHSRLERLNYYFTQNPVTGELINKNIDFTKAHHLVLSYGVSLAENWILKIEPYYQQLYSVPVIADSSFSFINMQTEWFFSERLQNTGKGRNYGIDVTIEKYMSKGYYLMFTASVFNSQYTGGDGVWRNTRFNRNYLFNLLGGKEWQVGKNKRNMIGLNLRLTLQGGDRFTPVDVASSLTAREVVYNENQAFSKQIAPSFLVHFTASYKLNRQKTSHEFALKILNATMYSDFFGYRYNQVNNTIDENREATIIPNLSYRIEF